MSKQPQAARLAVWAGAAALAIFAPASRADSSSDALINKLEQKGILTSEEAKALRAESEQTETNLINQLPASKWRIADSVKTLGLFGDFRLRYEYRGADNPFSKPAAGSIPGDGNSGETGKTYDRERFRYALRFGIRGDLIDDWSYGLRLETSANPRSPWVTFGDDTGKSSTAPISGTPSDKSSDTIYVGQAYLHWHPDSWFEIMAGRMPMPLYTTPMVWDSDINPEGAFEKIKYTAGPVDIFADFGQFDYQDPSVAQEAPSGDTFILANQAGVNVRFGRSMSFKVAPVVYVYVGHGNPPAPQTQAINVNPQNLYYTFVGQGDPSGPYKGFNVTYNQNGINNLEIVEAPAEFQFKIYHTPLGTLQARIFGDLAYNYEGDDRARAAFKAAPAAFPGLKHAVTGEDAAYQIGIGLGSDGPLYGPTQGLAYGTTSKKGAWEARFYWQHIDQYALDVNLIDSDFFEGRANLQGFFVAFSYSITDAIIGTLRYGTANQIDNRLGTGGNNLDMPLLNPIRNYQLVQADLTWRF
jgi:hypothetical protein